MMARTGTDRSSRRPFRWQRRNGCACVDWSRAGSTRRRGDEQAAGVGNVPREGERSAVSRYRQVLRRLVVGMVALAAVLLLAAVAVPRISQAAARWLAAQPVRGHTLQVDGVKPGPSLPGAGLVRGVPELAAATYATLDAGNEFNLLGAVGRWTGGGARGASLSVRTSLDGHTWSGWHSLDLEPAQGDVSARKLVAEPLWVGTARYVEFRRGGNVKDLRLAFIDSLGDATTSERVITGIKSAVAAITGLGAIQTARAQTTTPTIVTRAEWGANESWRRADPSYADVKMAFIHHTVNANDYTAAQAPSLVRAIYYYHAVTCGYNDIGYNFLIDRFGTIYEGRYGGIDRGVIGAQTLGFNTGSTGIALIGTFTSVAPSPAAVASLEQLLAWKLDVHHVDPLSFAAMVCGTTGKFMAGQAVMLPAISGHRDANYTECPGAQLYALLPQIRAAVAAIGTPKIYAPAATPATISPNGDGVDDSASITFSASEDVTWQATIANQSGTTVRTFTGTGSAASLTWDGRDASGAVVPDGSYTVTLAAQSASGTATPATLTITIAGSSSTPAFSGVLRTEALRAFAVRRGHAARFRYQVAYEPGSGDTVYTKASVVLRLRDAAGKPRGTISLPHIPLNKVRSYCIAHCRLARGSYKYAVYATLPDGTVQQRIGQAKFVVR